MTDPIVFFETSDGLALSNLAERIDAQIRQGDDGGIVVTSVAPLEAAPVGSLTFIDNPKYLPALENTKAAAVICSERNAAHVREGVTALTSSNPYRAFALAAAALFPKAMKLQPIIGHGVSKGAFVHESAVLEDSVTVEHGAVVGADAYIGEGTVIGPNSVVGPKVHVGRNSSISPNVTLLNALVGDDVYLHSGVRVGSDGFGFSMGPGGHLKIPQIGRVVIQNNVEIGANSCIDRGSNRDTIIGEGTKIDDLVMVGHNVKIGRHCVIVSQTGIAGSAELGDYVVLGGRVAVNGHIKIGDGAQLAGLSGIANDVPPGVQWGGVPARPIRHWMREVGRLRREALEMEKKRESKSNE